MLTLQTFSDGGARGNPGPAAIGVVLCDEQGQVIHEESRTIGHRTNNQAEYEAMILTLELAKARKAKRLHCHADSELLIFQLQGTYRIKDPNLKILSEKVKSLLPAFESVSFQQVPREHPMIARADKLLNKTLNQAKKNPTMPKPNPGSSSANPAQRELF